MKKIIILSMIFCVSSFLFSYEYIMNNNPSGIGAHAGSMKILTWTGNADEGYYNLAIPARNQFYYYGRLVTHLQITTNGYVVLGYGSAPATSVDYSNGSLPDPSVGYANSMVAPLWDDYWLNGHAQGQGDVYYSFVTNTNYNDYISVEWRAVEVVGGGDTTLRTFAVGFCSKDNCYRANTVIFAYTDTDSGLGGYANGSTATVGIENSTGTVGELYAYNEANVTDGLRITFTPFVPIYGSTIDLWESTYDGYPDAIIFRPSNGDWYYYNSDGTTRSRHWGAKGDVAVPGDYDGDGDSDECVFRPSNGYWYGTDPSFSTQWGASGDIPVPADYNGDGSLDMAVFRPSNGYWYVYIRGSGVTYSWQWGQPGDIPLPADYGDDLFSDLAVFRPVNNTWYIRKSSDWGIIQKQWGAEGDIPMPGNFNTNAYSTPTVFRPSNGYWYYLDQYTSANASDQWGQDGDVPVPGDQNCGGMSEEVVFRPGNGYWYLILSDYLPSSFQWGTLGDKPRFRRSFWIVSPPLASGDSDH